MEYRSPLGYNFKLEQSLTALKEEKATETPKKSDCLSLDHSGSKKVFDSENRRYSGGSRNYTPARPRNSNDWKSPNPRNSQDEPVPIEQFYHPSMLENPWEELEKEFNPSQEIS